MTTQTAEQEFNTADMKNLHYHAFNYRNAHSTEASKAFDILEDFVNRYGIAASDRWRDEWSEVCNENQILHNTCDEQQKYLSEQAAEIERLRVQLAGCGVAAMQNTVASIADRCAKGGYGYSESYADVCRAVDREITLREAVEKQAAEIERLKATLEQMISAFQPYAWGSADNKADALSDARAALGEGK